MNWSKCKTIFIYFFLLIDIILLSIVVYSNIQDSYVSKKDINSICNYLNTQKIEISPKVIPRWVSKMKNIELLNVLRSDSALVTQFKNKDTKNMPVENKTYKSGNKTLIIDNNYFIYKDHSAFSGQTIREKDVVSKVKIYLTSLGFDMNSTKSSDIQEKNNSFTFTYYKSLSHTLLSEAKLIVHVNPDGSLSISGIWFNPILHDSYTRVAPRSVTDVLVLFSRDMAERKLKNVSITGIHLFYYIDSIETYHRTFTASFTWQIETKDNKTYFYDARS